MSEQDQAAAEVAAQQRQVTGTVAAGTAQQSPTQDAAAAAAAAEYARTHPVPNAAPAPAFSAQPAGEANPVAVAQAMNPFAAVDPAVMDALREQIVRDVRAQFEAEARQKEIDSTKQSGWYAAPDGWVRTEDRPAPTLPGEHKYDTAALTRDVFLPGGGTQPVTSHVMVTPQGDLVAAV